MVVLPLLLTLRVLAVPRGMPRQAVCSHVESWFRPLGALALFLLEDFYRFGLACSKVFEHFRLGLCSLDLLALGDTVSSIVYNCWWAKPG
jgi:hypothetical protein